MRKAEIERVTKETQIKVKVQLDDKGKAEIDTGIGFFDHMLTALSVHSGISMSVKVIGEDVFYSCDALQEIIVPKGCKEKFVEMLPDWREQIKEEE